MMVPIHDQPLADTVVSLRGVTRENFRAVGALKVRPEQEENVASNSLLQSDFSAPRHGFVPSAPMKLPLALSCCA